MGVIESFVSEAQNQLNAVAQSGFGSTLDRMGNLTAVMATLAVVLLGINMLLQVRPMSASEVIVTFIKLIVIGTIGLNWGQFNQIAYAVQGGIDYIAQGLLGQFGSASTSGGLAGGMDNFISYFNDKANAAVDRLGVFARAIMSFYVYTNLGFLAAIVSLVLIFSMVMVTVYIAMAPIFIAMSIFDVTKDYFNRWLQGLVTYMLYPLVTAAMLGGIIRIVTNFIKGFDESTSETIADFIPFIACLFIMTICTLAIPVIVSSLSGMIQAARLGGVSQQARGLTMGLGRQVDKAAGSTIGGYAADKIGQGAAATARAADNAGVLARDGFHHNMTNRIWQRNQKYK